LSRNVLCKKIEGEAVALVRESSLVLNYLALKEMAKGFL